MRWRRSYWLSVVAPLVGVTALAFLAPAPLDSLRNLVFDSYQRAEPRQWDASLPVRIVDIDDASLASIGQWPWPRSRMAELVDRLTEAGAAVVVFDIVFAEPDRTNIDAVLSLLPASATRDQLARELSGLPSSDDRLAQAMAGKPVVLGATGTGSAAGAAFPMKQGVAKAGDDPLPFLLPFPSVIAPLKPLSDAAAGIGLFNWLPDHDQVIRRVPLISRVGTTIAPSLAVETLRVAQGASTLVIRSSNASGETAFGSHTGVNTIKIGQFQVATGPQGDLRVKFSRHEPGRFISALKIFEGKPDAPAPDADVNGAIVFVGTSAPGLLDQRATPIDASVPGVEVHAQVVEHILAGGALTRPDWAAGAEIVGTVLICLLFIGLLPIVSPLVLAVLGAGFVGALAGLSWFLFSSHDLLIDPVVPSLSCGLVYLSGVMNLYWTEQSQKRQVRQAFERFVAPAVVERLANNPQRLVLGGELRPLTLLFCDLRDFTALSEGLDAQRLTHFMNEYLTPMTDIVLDHNGTVDKYMGDAIMAFWNAPLDDAQHAARAVTTVLAMIEALVALNARWQAEAAAEGRSFPIVRAGFGLNTGDCCVGNLGSTRRFDYSAIGDDVNIASRVEGATKYLGLDFLATEPTVALAPDFAWLDADQLTLKGKQQATRVFTAAGDAAFAKTPDFAALRSAHDEMLAAWRGRDFATVARLAGSARDLAPARLHGLYSIYAARAEVFVGAPPPDDWTGGTALEDK